MKYLLFILKINFKFFCFFMEKIIEYNYILGMLIAMFIQNL